MAVVKQICQLFRKHAWQKKTWSDLHPHAKVLECKPLGRGYLIVAEDGGERRTILADWKGEEVEVLP